MLTPPELLAIQDRQNAIVAKRRVPSAQEFSDFLGFPIDDGDFMLEQYPAACVPVNYTLRAHNDIWLFIHDADDVEKWGQFLAEWLPGGLQRFGELRGQEFMW